jgi:hypothetical protein
MQQLASCLHVVIWGWQLRKLRCGYAIEVRQPEFVGIGLLERREILDETREWHSRRQIRSQIFVARLDLVEKGRPTPAIVDGVVCRPNETWRVGALAYDGIADERASGCGG